MHVRCRHAKTNIVSRRTRFVFVRPEFMRNLQLDLGNPENAWKVDYNRALSGLHTSISAHITEDMDLSPEEALNEYRR
jgi:hypothetical protein